MIVRVVVVAWWVQDSGKQLMIAVSAHFPSSERFYCLSPYCRAFHMRRQEEKANGFDAVNEMRIPVVVFNGALSTTKLYEVPEKKRNRRSPKEHDITILKGN